ncbi:hypothetical protein MGYG_07738 [Nannizzia gypsea CBS 118893]|uniref:Uncharacterized protein n=1 Tax=Arthroderma gypseum (strain ATCC MYA-4604 / CBS 118893) TaxID=535722 RepID=E4V406_ARTGP|nr:hypothetical protein MGYG_07738 [Nannizzia gypsea CBS 118893]EFR04730.1 hypothetical protein MGYG_07738 [Nannizzia gypsea CBS 118893]
MGALIKNSLERGEPSASGRVIVRRLAKATDGGFVCLVQRRMLWLKDVSRTSTKQQQIRS